MKEYSFLVSCKVYVDVMATSKAEAVKKINGSGLFDEEPLPGCAKAKRISIQPTKELGTEDLYGVYVP